ncbi:MAG: LysE family translocator [Sphingomonadales bacterium]|nr:LysE family translocator [Sphingomonadales bacterium]
MTMHLADFIGFVLAVLLLEITPGPNMGWLAGVSAIQGRVAGLAAVVGIAIGLTLNSLLGAMGVAALLLEEPGWQAGMRGAGALVMLWLAVSTWRESRDAIAGQAPQRFAGAGATFAAGLMINVFNPKSVLFFVAVVPPFLHGRAPSLGLAMLLAGVSVGIATAIHLMIVGAASRGQEWLARSGYVRTLQRAMALLMAGAGLWLAGSLLG